MGHYEERLEADLNRIKAQIGDLGKMAGEAVRAAVRSVLNLNRELAADTILGDQRINRAVRESDRLCHAFVARHLPSAGILRTISAVLRLNVALERIGDYAVTIARETAQLSQTVPDTMSGDIEVMAEQSQSMLDQAIKSFIEGNAEMARGTRTMAAQVDTTFDRVFDDLVREAESQTRPVQDLFGYLIVFNRLERVSDQAKNICEETIFAETGELVRPRRPRVLFVDKKNTTWSLLAETLARRAFPESGEYASAGWEVAPGVHPELVTFLESKGLDSTGLAPTSLPTTHDELDDYHIIIGLGEGPREHLAQLPFRTVITAWDVMAGIDPGDVTQENLEAVAQTLSVRLRDLMEVLHGEHAD